MDALRRLLSGDNPVEELFAADKAGTLATLEPAIAALRMEPGRARHKDNLTHSIKVLGNAISREGDVPDLVLRTAALFHDVGKPATRQFVGGKVTFQNHEHVGARMVKKILPKHGYTPDEVATIALLVGLHMRSHSFESHDWTDSAVRRLITDAGDERTLNRLIILFYADTTTSHEKKERRIHRSVAALQEEIARVKAADARKALRPALNGNEVMELTGLKPGRALGQVMRWLNSDEGIRLSREDAIDAVRKFPVGRPARDCRFDD